MGEMNLSEAWVFGDGFPEEGTLELNKRSAIKMKYVLGFKEKGISEESEKAIGADNAASEDENDTRQVWRDRLASDYGGFFGSLPGFWSLSQEV